MLTGVHFLLTYMCNSECDHCFIYSGPRAKGTFTLSQIREALNGITKIGTVKRIYFEGGEPFLFYPLMLEGIKLARSMEFEVGVVTNAYYATSDENAEFWLKPLAEMGISNLSISNDTFHYEGAENPAQRASKVATRLGIPAAEIRIEEPVVKTTTGEQQDKGEPVVGGGVMFKGRAVEKLAAELPRRRWEEFTECPHEDLGSPQRVHLDPYGNIHLCQGLSMGNIRQTFLSEIIRNYDADVHPICRSLIRGGPALLAKEYKVKHQDKYVDACHFCYLVRLALLDRFPQYLTPRQVYGLK